MSDKSVLANVTWLFEKELQRREIGSVVIDRAFLNVLENPNTAFYDLAAAMRERAKLLGLDLVFTVYDGFDSRFNDRVIILSWKPASEVIDKPFCDQCKGPYAGWLKEQYGGHWDTCPNRVNTQGEN